MAMRKKKVYRVIWGSFKDKLVCTDLCLPPSSHTLQQIGAFLTLADNLSGNGGSYRFLGPLPQFPPDGVVSLNREEELTETANRAPWHCGK